MTTTLTAARHRIAQYRDARNRAYAWFEADEITGEQLDGLVDWINGEIMALQDALAA